MKLLALLLLLAPLPALADPISIFASVLAVSGSAAAATAIATTVSFLATYGTVVGLVAVNVFGAANARRQARNAAARQRSQYNASLQDRSVTALTANPPWRVVYGRCITGGDVVAIFTTDKTAVRTNGTTYTKPDGLKHLVIHVASHQVQAINEVFIDGVPLGTLDGAGWVTGGDFYKANQPAARSIQIAPGGFVDVSPAVVSVLSSYIQQGSNLEAVYLPQAVTLSNGNTRITNPNGSNVVMVDYTINTDAARVRISKHLGTDEQTVDGYLNGVAPSQWTSSHRLRGLAYVVVTLDLEETRFQGGPPNLTFDVSGRLVYDTRYAATLYTVNPAMIVRDFLMAPWGFGCAAGEIDIALCNAAANACDARSLGSVQTHSGPVQFSSVFDTMYFISVRWFSTGDGVRFTTTGTLPAPLVPGTTYYVIVETSRHEFKLATSIANAQAGTAIFLTSVGSGTHTGTWYDYPTFTCNGSFTTSDSREGVLDDLCQSMGGFATYGATWGIVAGAWTPSVMTLGDDDLDGQIEIVQAGAGMDTLFNGLRGQYIAAGKSSPSDFDSYSNSVFVAADGAELWSDITLPYTDSKPRARNLARIFTERNRDGLVIRYPAKLKAWPLQIGDRVTVNSTEYGFVAKTFRVTDWQFGIGTAVQLTLQEDAAAVYDLADAATADPAPNTALPGPWSVSALTGVSATSGVATVLKSATNPLVPRILVSWDAVTDAYVADGSGRIEVLWKRPLAPWQQIDLPGDSTQTYISGVDDKDYVLIEARARNGLGQVGPSTFVGHLVAGGAALGWGDVSGRPWMFRCTSRGLSDTAAPFAGGDWAAGAVLNAETGAVLTSNSSMYSVGTVHRITGAWVHVGYFNVYSDGLEGSASGIAAANAMAAALNAIGGDYVVVVTTWDEPKTNRLQGNLPAAMYRCGASRAVFGSSSFQFRGAYVLIGLPGAGEGNGFEAYQGAVSGDTSAWCDVAFTLQNGQPIIGGGGRVLTVGTAQLEPNAATNGVTVDSSEVVGSTGSPGASVRVATLWGPAVTTDAGDELDIVVSGVLSETFWSQATVGSVELWLTRAPEFGGTQTEFGTRRRFLTPIDAYSNATNIPLDMTGQITPGAVTQTYVLRVSITYRDAAGAAKQCAKDVSAVAQWRIVRRKR